MVTYVRLAVACALLLSIAVAVLTWAGVAQRRAVVTAGLRAVVQLVVVAAILGAVFRAPITVVLVIAAMFSVAVWTAARRLASHPFIERRVGVACAAGAATVIGVIMLVPAVPRDVRSLVAVSGIVIGGAMSAATLTGRRLDDGLRRRRDEVEAWLSIGATTRQAVRPIAREAVFEALIPALDQTRTVGLVTLPGAFVGALIGGGDAGFAARFQIVVLTGLLCAQAITASILAWLLGAPLELPE